MKIDLLEQLRCQCKMILFDLEPFGHLISLPVWTVYLAIETMIVQSTNDCSASEEEGKTLQGGKDENQNDNKMDEDKGRGTSGEIGDISEKKRKFITKYSVPKGRFSFSHIFLVHQLRR